MRDEAIDILARQLVLLQNAVRHLRHLLHRILEDVLSILMNTMHFLVNRLVRRRVQTSPSRHEQVLPAHALDLRHMIDNALFSILRRLEQNRARSIAKNNAHRAVGVIGHRRIHV